jgi:hypothetical protein
VSVVVCLFREGECSEGVGGTGRDREVCHANTTGERGRAPRGDTANIKLKNTYYHTHSAPVSSERRHGAPRRRIIKTHRGAAMAASVLDASARRARPLASGCSDPIRCISSWRRGIFHKAGMGGRAAAFCASSCSRRCCSRWWG